MFKVEDSGEVQLGENTLTFTLVDGMLSIAMNGIQKAEVRIDEPTVTKPVTKPEPEPESAAPNIEHLPKGWYFDGDVLMRGGADDGSGNLVGGEPVHSVHFNTVET